MQLAAIGIEGVRSRAWIGATGLDRGVVATGSGPEPGPAPGQLLGRVMGEVSRDAELGHGIDRHQRHITRTSGQNKRHE